MRIIIEMKDGIKQERNKEDSFNIREYGAMIPYLVNESTNYDRQTIEKSQLKRIIIEP